MLKLEFWGQSCSQNIIQVREDLAFNVWNKKLYKISHFQWTVRINLRVCRIFFCTSMCDGLNIYMYTEVSNLNCELSSATLFSTFSTKTTFKELLGFPWQVKFRWSLTLILQRAAWIILLWYKNRSHDNFADFLVYRSSNLVKS